MTEPTTQDAEPQTEAGQAREERGTCPECGAPVVVRHYKYREEWTYAATEGAESREGLDPERLARAVLDEATCSRWGDLHSIRWASETFAALVAQRYDGTMPDEFRDPS